MAEHATFDAPLAQFKASNAATGEFEALVSVFGNIDHGGDRVMPGAFAKTIAQWEEKAAPIPVIWNHDWDNPLHHIGSVAPGDAVETDDGLVVKGQLDMDNPVAAYIHRLLSERRVKEFSFGYSVRDAERRDGALELREIELYEVGPTLKGMNPETQLLMAKAFPGSFKAGARHSKETIAAVQRHVDDAQRGLDELKAHFLADEASTPKSDDAKTPPGTASDPDADLMTDIHLMKERLR